MRILICDLFANGNGNDAIPYDSIIHIPDITTCTNGDVLNKGDIFNISKDDIIIFSANEDGMHYVKKINMTIPSLFAKMIDIRSALKKQYPGIVIYNDPIHFDDIGNKLHTYNLLQHLKYIPTYSQFPDEKWDTFPCIVSASRASGGRFRTRCNTSDELINSGRRIQRAKGSTFIVECIDSYIPELKCMHNLRLMVVNDTLVDWFCRPGKEWNIHTGTQDLEKLQLANDWFVEWCEKHKHKQTVTTFISDIFSVIGKGAYSYDVIIVDDMMYLCEVGYKFWDDTVAKTIPLDKLTKSKEAYKEQLKRLIL